MTKKVMYLSVVYCFFVNKIYIDMLEYQLREEGGPDLEFDEDFILLDYKEKHWRDFIVVKNEENKKVVSLIWELYTKDMENLIKRYFKVAVPHSKEGGII